MCVLAHVCSDRQCIELTLRTGMLVMWFFFPGFRAHVPRCVEEKPGIPNQCLGPSTAVIVYGNYLLSFLPHEFWADNNCTQESCNGWNNSTDTKLPLLSAITSNHDFYFLERMAKANLVSVGWKLQFNVDGTFDSWNDLNCKVIKTTQGLRFLVVVMLCGRCITRCIVSAWGYRDVGREAGVQPCSVSR